jgi:tetratricopeptide (TPR) repeat protein
MKKPFRMSFLRTASAVLLLATGFAVAARGQEPKASDFGVATFANSGAAAAQQPFLRGLAAMHDFEWESAAENFRKAEGIDAKFAMAYWGEALSHNDGIHFQQDTEAGRAALNKLAPTQEGRLAKCGTDRERDYMRAVDALYNAPGTKEERDFKYSAAMGALYQKYPDDVDAGALYALSLLSTAHHGRDFAVYMKSLAVLEPLFFAHPNHPGVDHYLIHSVDDPVHAPLGLLAARNYSKVALKAPHAQHMTSHIFVAMGMWDDVVKANEIATAVLNEQNAQQGKPPTVCGHYNFWLEYGHLQQGRFQDARTVLQACKDAAVSSAGSGRGPNQGLIGGYAQMRLRYLLDTDDWKGDVARWPVPEGANAATRLSFTFADGFGAVRRGDLKAAHEALVAMNTANGAERSGVGTGAATAADFTARATLLQQELQAMLDAAEGKRDDAIALLRKSAASENTMPFEYGPPFIDKPTAELLGEVLLDAQRPAEAREAFQTALGRTPQRTAVLMGLSRAMKAEGDTLDAQQTSAKLRDIWHAADHVPEEVR